MLEEGPGKTGTNKPTDETILGPAHKMASRHSQRQRWKKTKSRRHLAAADSLNKLFGLAITGIKLGTEVTWMLLGAFLETGF